MLSAACHALPQPIVEADLITSHKSSLSAEEDHIGKLNAPDNSLWKLTFDLREKSLFKNKKNITRGWRCSSGAINCTSWFPSVDNDQLIGLSRLNSWADSRDVKKLNSFQEVDLQLFIKIIIRMLFYHLLSKRCAFANFICQTMKVSSWVSAMEEFRCHVLGTQRCFGWDACVKWHLDPSRTSHCSILFSDIHSACRWVECCGSTSCIVFVLVSLFIKQIPW